MKTFIKEKKLGKVATLFFFFSIAMIAFTKADTIAFSQTGFNRSNSERIRRHFTYYQDNEGNWIYDGNIIDVDSIAPKDTIRFICLIPKFRTLVVVNSTSQFGIFLTKKAYNEIKKHKSIKSIKITELGNVLTQKTNYIHEYYDSLNTIHDQLISAQKDSITKLNIIRDKQLRAKRDSSYRFESSPNYVDITSYLETNPTSSSYNRLECIDTNCEYYPSDKKLFISSIKNDTLITGIVKREFCGIPRTSFHAFVMPSNFKNNEIVDRHLRIWGDSLTYTEKMPILNYIKDLNSSFNIDFYKTVKSKVPYGFIGEWSWTKEYGPVTLKITYVNTNAKTIKYIRFYFSVLNDVDDVRGTGSFQGTGPLEEFETATWDFDSSNCWPAGDASRMKITKILITYMNGSQVTLNGPKIKYADD